MVGWDAWLGFGPFLYALYPTHCWLQAAVQQRIAAGGQYVCRHVQTSFLVCPKSKRMPHHRYCFLLHVIWIALESLRCLLWNSSNWTWCFTFLPRGFFDCNIPWSLQPGHYVIEFSLFYTFDACGNKLQHIPESEINHCCPSSLPLSLDHGKKKYCNNPVPKVQKCFCPT